jgi:putative DNA methylase
VVFGQFVDDPSSWPELYPNEAAQDKERQRLFRIIEELVKWENSNNEVVINAARLAIARSVARNRKADGEGNERDDAVLTKDVEPAVVNKYLAEVAPPVHDPFAGGGSIPIAVSTCLVPGSGAFELA